MALVRVYHPETNEPFDLPEAKATALRLEQGWLSQPFERVVEEDKPKPDNGLNPRTFPVVDPTALGWRPPADDEQHRPRGRGRRRAEPATPPEDDVPLL